MAPTRRGVRSSFATHAVRTRSGTWDGPLLRLPDGESIRRYLRTHYLPASVADRLTAPLTVTKRGCLVIAVKED